MIVLPMGTRVEWGSPPQQGTVVQQDETEVIIEPDAGYHGHTVLPIHRLRRVA